MSSKVCIIGAGVSGLLLVLFLHTHISPEEITIVDPYFDGGDLARKWGNVVSNTTWDITLNTIKKYLPELSLPAWATELPGDKPTPLATIASLFRDLTTPILKKCNTIQGYVEKVNYASPTWTVTIQSDTQKSVQATALFLCQGAEPKSLDLPTRSIPLEVALDPHRLKQYIRPNFDRVTVFGMSHSGVLVMRNLVECNTSKITGVYDKEKPFLWARDGEYNGLKLDAAIIADRILAGEYPSIALTRSVSDVIRETVKSDWTVYAIGFQPRKGISICVDSTPITLKYGPTSGKLLEASNAWMFGIVAPSQAPDGIHWDVGVSSFADHIHAQLQNILEALS